MSTSTTSATPSHADSLDLLATEPLSGLRYRKRPAATPDRPAARLLLLHGVGGNEQNLVPLARSIDARIEVLLVQAPLTLAAQSYAWFQVRFGATGPVIHAEQAEQSRRQLITFIQALHESDADSAALPTVIGGFSQGGILSASVGLSAPDIVRGFAILSGRILPELAPHVASRDALSGLSAFIAHGHFDDKLVVEWAQRADAWLSDLGVPHQTHIYPMGHELTPAVVTDFQQWLGTFHFAQ